MVTITREAQKINVHSFILKWLYDTINTMKRKIVKQQTIVKTALKLFSSQGFHQTSIEDIARALGISVGTVYNYFSSKQALAQESLGYVTQRLTLELQHINYIPASTQEKIHAFVQVYFRLMREEPETLEYFSRVYLTNRKLFCSTEERCVLDYAQAFIYEVRTMINNGVHEGVLRERDFCVAFALIIGTLGAVNFLRGERMLEHELESYEEEISDTLYQALSH